MRRVALIVVEVLLAVAALVAGLIAFGTRPAPPLSPAAVAAFKGVDFTTLPPMEHYNARDGAQLGYRRYGLPAGAVATRVIVLLHGASDSGPTMHPLAESLRAAGLVVYVPELRGHGDSEPSGDIRYVGQLEDDLVDFAAMLRRREGSEPLRLAGFSAGGGLALRFAGGPYAQLFSGYLLLSPGLAYQGPMVRPAGEAASSVRNFAVTCRGSSACRSPTPSASMPSTACRSSPSQSPRTRKPSRAPTRCVWRAASRPRTTARPSPPSRCRPP
jgi:alpha-beta hydrolase superfamily lysophospholipase